MTMNYVDKGILFEVFCSTFEGKGMSANIAFPADLGSTSGWHFWDCFTFSPKMHNWTRWLILLCMPFHFHTFPPCALFSPSSSTFKMLSQNFSPKRPLVSHLLYKKIWSHHSGPHSFCPSWSPPAARQPSWLSVRPVALRTHLAYSLVSVALFPYPEGCPWPLSKIPPTHSLLLLLSVPLHPISVSSLVLITPDLDIYLDIR